MDSYKTVKGEAQSSFIEKKSEFISYIRHVSAEEEAIDFIAEIRAKHRKATHNCYAYILRDNNIARHSDDGEPQGTAGVPIYDTLRKEGLSDVACVVTRYFGGIMLGAGGLVRAYGRGASDVVNSAVIQDFHMADKISLTFSYSLFGRIKQIIANAADSVKIAEECFGGDVRVTLYVKENMAQSLTAELTDACAGDIVIENLQKEYYDFG